MRSVRNLVLLVLVGAFLLGVWSTHRPRPARSEPSSKPPFRTAAESRAHTGQPTARLTGVETSRQDGFDRVEFTFDGAVPSWRIGYAPVVRDGAGGVLALQGRAPLAVAFRPAQAHDPGGSSSFGPQSRTPGYGSLRQVRLAGDIEGRVRFGLGLGARAGFRVLEATGPPRIIVDIRA